MFGRARGSGTLGFVWPIVSALLLILYLTSTQSAADVWKSGKPELPAGLWEATAASGDGQYRIAIVADLDKKSRVADSKKPTFRSYWREATLRVSGKDKWTVEWDDATELRSQLNEAGRGMELSDLTKFGGRMYTFDDRSGTVFEVLGDRVGKRSVVPRTILMEGNGEHGKGQKTEWATVKDGKMYIGSFGKEYVGKDGEVTSLGNLWVSVLDSTGRVSHEDWTQKYNAVRKVTDSLFPAYHIIETVVWSSVQRKWYVLPRRVSTEPYDEVKDESRGSNVVITCDEQFDSCSKMEVGVLTPTRGFSAAAFLPGSRDTIMVAIKTEEDDEAGTQASFITIFRFSDGRTLLEEQAIPGDPSDPSKGIKYEGLAFI